MPNYDFMCKRDHVTERFFRMADKPKFIICPKCGSRANSIVSNVNFNNGIGIFWPKDAIHSGHTVENLGPEPIHVNSKAEYRELLKATGSREAG